jgi:hypothetical protein
MPRTQVKIQAGSRTIWSVCRANLAPRAENLARDHGGAAQPLESLDQEDATLRAVKRKREGSSECVRRWPAQETALPAQRIVIPRMPAAVDLSNEQVLGDGDESGFLLAPAPESILWADMDRVANEQSLLILAGHAIYEHGAWHGARSAEDEPVLEAHVRRAFAIAKHLGFRALVPSGGRTRPELASVRAGRVSRSEAEGMIAFAQERELDPGAAEIVAEPYARDTFENMLFSVLAFHRRFGVWPDTVGIVSWKFKAARTYLIAAGLRLQRFRFFGCGDLTDPRDCAWEVVAHLKLVGDTQPGELPSLLDPLHRDREFRSKREQRTPPESVDSYLTAVKLAYDPAHRHGHGRIGAVLDDVERLSPGQGWQQVAWPWLEKPL